MPNTTRGGTVVSVNQNICLPFICAQKPYQSPFHLCPETLSMKINELHDDTYSSYTYQYV